ncbi:MAG: glycosyl hydrolase 53 family protein [Lachnospiraceae bacterium]|nr:glycosyl hydrolase 53 family protein [Lachnospiraceae bacterium]
MECLCGWKWHLRYAILDADSADIFLGKIFEKSGRNSMRRAWKRLAAIGLSVGLSLGAMWGCGTKEAASGAENTAQTAHEEAAPEETVQVESVGEITTFPLPQASEESEIFLAPIPDIADDFIRGMDASAVLAEEKSGVKYYNFEGQEQDVFMTLAQAGINYIRLRVWNDPYDENGNGYGGGNNDVPTAIELGRRAAKYGMKVCIDFHYSDFWADPKKQFAPKAWEGMSVEKKSSALYDFTKESLAKILNAGVDVGMVQIGNEINTGMAGEKKTADVAQLLSAGSRAVRETAQTYGKEIQVVVHYTDIHHEGQTEGIAEDLENAAVDYDIFAFSYYPFWHGDRENMQAIAKMLQEKFRKKVVIAETSYCYTSEDGDDSGNSVNGVDDLVPGYGATVQSQATMIRDICEAANEAGVLGVFYWEGTWIPVGKTKAQNSPIWEEFGSGWASSYAKDYDPNDAGKYYGGCSWDNQAMFDFEGHPLASLNVFKYLKFGATAPLAVEQVPDVEILQETGVPLEMPEAVDVIYNDPSVKEQAAVTWDEEQLSSVDTNMPDLYEVKGTLEDGSSVVAHVKVESVNYIENPSFEEADTSMWKVAYEGGSNPTDFQKKADDAHEGEIAFHFWSGDSDMEFSIEQELAALEAGTYKLSVFAQGGDVSDDCEMELYAVTADGELTDTFMMSGWVNWQNPTISEIKVTDSLTIGVRIKSNKGSWGTVDDFVLNRISD